MPGNMAGKLSRLPLSCEVAVHRLRGAVGAQGRGRDLRPAGGEREEIRGSLLCRVVQAARPIS